MRVLLMIMNSGANQGSIFHWSRDHRLHHKFSDTDLDPHDISKGFFFAHVGWLLVNKSPQLVEEGKRIDMTDLLNDPVVMFQKKHYLPLSVAVCFLLPSIHSINSSPYILLCVWHALLLLLLLVDDHLRDHSQLHLVC